MILNAVVEKLKRRSPPKTCDLAPTGECGRAHSPDIQEATLSRLDSEGSRFRHKEGD